VKTKPLGKTITTCVVAVVAAVCTAGCRNDDLLQHKQALGAAAVATEPKDGLALSIWPRQGKETFRKDEVILIDVKLTNITNGLPRPKDIPVYTEIAREGLLLYLELYKLDGGRRQHWLTERVDADLKERMKHYPHYVKLQPGFFIGRPLQFKKRLPPGIYELSVSYANNYDFCPLSAGLTPDQINLIGADLGLVKLWKGLLRSNTIVFKVLEE